MQHRPERRTWWAIVLLIACVAVPALHAHAVDASADHARCGACVLADGHLSLAPAIEPAEPRSERSAIAFPSSSPNRTLPKGGPPPVRGPPSA